MAEENTEKITKNIDESQNTVEDSIEQKEVAKLNQKIKKSDIAKEKIEYAKTLKSEINEQLNECMKNIEEEIEKLDRQKEQFIASALKPAEDLLHKAGIDEDMSIEQASMQVELPDADADSVEIKELSSGRFKGFFWALIAGLASLFGWCFIAAKSLGVPIPPQKVPDLDRLNKMFEWTSQQIGQDANANIGTAVVIISVILIMWIVYTIIVSMRASHNLRLAEKTEEEISNYCRDKEECKQKMELVKEHIQNSAKTLEKYKVIIEEQNAKIKRALFLEEVEAYEDLHAKTKDDIEITKRMIVDAKKLLDTQIAKEGVLTPEAKEILQKTNKTINDRILEIYS